MFTHVLVQMQSEEEEAGILDSIAGTAYSGADEGMGAKEDADDANDSEDDEWVSEGEEDEENTEGVQPYEESEEEAPPSAAVRAQHSKGL